MKKMFLLSQLIVKLFALDLLTFLHKNLLIFNHLQKYHKNYKIGKDNPM